MNRDREVRAHAEPYRDKINLDVDPQRFMPRNRTAPMKSLPLDFKPTPYSVIVGRGKLCTDSVGNRRLRVLATTFLQKYSDASTSKIEKSTTVSRIVEITQEACPVGAFIKLDDGRWWEVADHTAREKGEYAEQISRSEVLSTTTFAGLKPCLRFNSYTIFQSRLRHSGLVGGYLSIEFQIQGCCSVSHLWWIVATATKRQLDSTITIGNEEKARRQQAQGKITLKKICFCNISGRTRNHYY